MVRTVLAAAVSPGAVRTYEALLRAIVPKAAAQLGSDVLPMDKESLSSWFFVSVLVVEPKSPSRSASKPAACWRAVRGPCITFDSERSFGIGAFWVDIKKLRFHVPRENSPLLW